jgi:SPFH domain / Band 7 family
MTITIQLLVLLSAIGFLVLLRTKGWPVRVSLLEYQRAVLYRRGLPIREVNAGSHRVWSGTDKLMIVDTRPIQVSIENSTVALRDGLAAVYSISGSARVQDARKAIYSAQNYNQVPAFVLVCCTCLILNGFTSQELRGGKDRVVEEIASRARFRLADAGLELLAFRLNLISTTPIKPRPTE